MTSFQLLVVKYKQNFSATPFTTDFVGNYANSFEVKLVALRFNS